MRSTTAIYLNKIITSGSFPSDTRSRALQPSEPIHEKMPVALFRRTARITSRTSWSDPNIIAPVFIEQVTEKDYYTGRRRPI